MKKERKRLILFWIIFCSFFGAWKTVGTIMTCKKCDAIIFRLLIKRNKVRKKQANKYPGISNSSLTRLPVLCSLTPPPPTPLRPTSTRFSPQTVTTTIVVNRINFRFDPFQPPKHKEHQRESSTGTENRLTAELHKDNYPFYL